MVWAREALEDAHGGSTGLWFLDEVWKRGIKVKVGCYSFHQLEL